MSFIIKNESSTLHFSLNKVDIMVMTIRKGTSKDDIKCLLDKLSKTKKIAGIDAYKFCGVIKLKESPNSIQKRLRSEWN